MTLLAAFAPPQLGAAYTTSSILANNTQVDNAGIDVRLTQLRNLLAGTRAPGAGNGETNVINWSTSPGVLQQTNLPNGIADSFDGSLQVDGNGFPYVVRTTSPVAGRWGEAQSIPGAAFPNPNLSGASNPPLYVNVASANYTNPVRAGYSINIRDILNGLPPDAADDNFNAYDPYPYRAGGGEVGDADYYDAAGALLFPVERMRRWVTPADINGTGIVYAYNLGSRGVNNGFDVFGRVEFNSYFRPAGSPGVISTNYTVTNGVMASSDSTTLGAIYFPGAGAAYYGSGPNPGGIGIANVGGTPYLPDLTSNPTHGLEQGRFPNQNYYSAANGSYTFTPQNIGGSPVDENIDQGGPASGGAGPPVPLPTGTPAAFPSYDYVVNATVNSDGLNDADEMNLYQPNPLFDSPFGPGDLEWLYRQQDVDGAYLSSRLSQLAPISFTNGIDGPRRRRLFALDSWDLNNFAWTNDNPNGAFPSNSRYISTANAGFTTLNSLVTNPNINFTYNVNAAGVYNAANPALTPVFNPTIAVPSPTPGLAQRDNKINLNYPLPVSNDPNEPVRQKWINDTYQLLKSVLPPKAVDTPEELAALSQYVINIIDFRDTDSTMTHWINPDVQLAGIPIPNPAGTAAPMLSVPPTLILAGATWPPSYTGITPTPPPTTVMQLDQWGMEYNPVAINEVLAYSFLYATSASAYDPAGQPVLHRAGEHRDVSGAFVRHSDRVQSGA